MNIADLTPAPAPEAAVRFALAMRSRVPSGSGCYALCSFDRQVLYVGLTDDLSRRFEEHVLNDAKHAVVDGVRAFWFHWVVVPIVAIPRIERGWQNQYAAIHGRLPPLNKILSPIR